MDDDPLIHELRGLLGRADPVPPAVDAYARAALGWRSVDAELAELVYDSATDGEQLAAVRSGWAARTLSFEAGGIGVELEVSRDGATLALMGQLLPPQEADVEIRHGGKVAAVEADKLGRFSAQGINPGPVSLRCRVRVPPHAPAVETEWLPL